MQGAEEGNQVGGHQGGARWRSLWEEQQWRGAGRPLPSHTPHPHAPTHPPARPWCAGPAPSPRRRGSPAPCHLRKWGGGSGGVAQRQQAGHGAADQAARQPGSQAARHRAPAPLAPGAPSPQESHPPARPPARLPNTPPTQPPRPPTGIDVHQCPRLVEELCGEGDAKLGGHNRQAPLAEAVGCRGAAGGGRAGRHECMHCSAGGQGTAPWPGGSKPAGPCRENRWGQALQEESSHAGAWRRPSYLRCTAAPPACAWQSLMMSPLPPSTAAPGSPPASAQRAPRRPPAHSMDITAGHTWSAPERGAHAC